MCCRTQTQAQPNPNPSNPIGTSYLVCLSCLHWTRRPQPTHPFAQLKHPRRASVWCRTSTQPNSNPSLNDGQEKKRLRVVIYIYEWEFAVWHVFLLSIPKWLATEIRIQVANLACFLFNKGITATASTSCSPVAAPEQHTNYTVRNN